MQLIFKVLALTLLLESAPAMADHDRDQEESKGWSVGQTVRVTAWCADMDDLPRMMRAMSERGSAKFQAVIRDPESSCVSVGITPGARPIPAKVTDKLTAQRIPEGMIVYWEITDINERKGFTWTPLIVEGVET